MWFGKFFELFKKIKDIIVRGHLKVYTIRQSVTVAKNVSTLLNRIGNRRDVMCTFTQGIAECTIIISESETLKNKKIFIALY